MEISKGIEAIGQSLFFRKRRILAIADLHLGYEEMLNRQGVMMPRFNFKEIKARLEKILANTGKLEKIIILGDLKHEFGVISDQEWKEVLEMLDYLGRNCAEIILVRGNHDKILGPIANRKNVKLQDEFLLEPEKVLFIHGDKLPSKANLKKSDLIAMGHEHPAVSVKDGLKAETYKCFLKGKFEGKELIVLPSMNSAALGTDLTKEEILSPLLKKSNLSEFEVYAGEDEVYFLGKLGRLL